MGHLLNARVNYFRQLIGDTGKLVPVEIPAK